MEIIVILLLALALDLAFGEMPNAWHPVAWLGKLISLEARLAPKTGKTKQLAYGVGMVLITLGLIVAAFYFLLAYLREINPVVYIIVAGLLVKFTFSLRGLRQAVDAVRGLIARDKLTQARMSLKSLVGRDTDELNKNQLYRLQ